MTSGDEDKHQHARPLALVTGASSGIGFAFLDLLGADGYDIIAVARTTETLEREAARLKEHYGITLHVLSRDLTEPGVGAALHQAVQTTGQPLRLLINNAGFGTLGPFAEESLEDQLGMIDLNVRALVEVTHALLPDILETRGGIINIASLSAHLPMPYMAIYGASKRFVLTFSKLLHHELLPKGVMVTAVSPGYTESRFHERAGVARIKVPGLVPKQTAMAVARQGYRGHRKGRALVVPGFANRLTRWFGFLVQPLMSLIGLEANRRINPHTAYRGEDSLRDLDGER